MTASLPSDVRAVFDRFVTTELTTVDSAGQPITWPVTPYYKQGDPWIDVTTGLGLPKKANDAQANPLVSILFSDPTGSGLKDPPTVLVQGSAEVDDKNLESNRERYARESAEKLPDAARPPPTLQQFFSWYFRGSTSTSVRSGSTCGRRAPDPSRRPTTPTWRRFVPATRRSRERFHAGPEGGAGAWDRRSRARQALPDRRARDRLADGFPFSTRPGPRRRVQPADLH